jgi:hypothetical protein
MPRQFASTERQRYQGSFFDFLFRDPGGEDADTEAQFDEFLGRLTEYLQLDFLNSQDHSWRKPFLP